MTEIALHPPIYVLGRRGMFVRSTEQAAAFVREHTAGQSDRAAAQVLRRLEKATTAAGAERAARAFRAWIANRMRTGPDGVPATGPAAKAGHFRRPHAGETERRRVRSRPSRHASIGR